MIISYNLILKFLNINLWKLRYPIVLIKNKPIHLLTKLKLLIISDVRISLQDVFIQDVVRSMKLNHTEIYIITIDQLNTLVLPKKFFSYCWWLGIEMVNQYNGFNLSTPSLSNLKCNVDAKRNLWNQIIYLKDMN